MHTTPGVAPFGHRYPGLDVRRRCRARSAPATPDPLGHSPHPPARQLGIAPPSIPPEPVRDFAESIDQLLVPRFEINLRHGIVCVPCDLPRLAFDRSPKVAQEPVLVVDGLNFSLTRIPRKQHRPAPKERLDVHSWCSQRLPHDVRDQPFSASPTDRARVLRFIFVLPPSLDTLLTRGWPVVSFHQRICCAKRCVRADF